MCIRDRYQTEGRPLSWGAWARSTQVRKRCPSGFQGIYRLGPYISIRLLWSYYCSQSSQDLKKAHARPQVFVWWNFLQRMYWRCISTQSSSVYGYGWVRRWHKVATEIWCIKERLSNCPVTAVKLFRKIQRRNNNNHRYLKKHETPFPVYIAMSIHAKTRKKKLVQMLHEHGLSISYDRVLEISAQMGDAAVNKYVEDQIVCPPGLNSGLFTTTAMDNIDNNPTATTATTSFHMTSISVFQHPTHKTIKVKNVEQSHLEEKRLREFLNYQIPSPISLLHFSRRRTYLLLKSRNDTNTTQLKSQLKLEYEWLEQVSVTQEIDGAVNVTWLAHYASKKTSLHLRSVLQPCCLFFEIKHTQLPLLGLWWTRWKKQWHSWIQNKYLSSQMTNLSMQLWSRSSGICLAVMEKTSSSSCSEVNISSWLHWNLSDLSCRTVVGQEPLQKLEYWSSCFGNSRIISYSHKHHEDPSDDQITACGLYKLLKAAYADYCAVEVGQRLDSEAWRESRKLQSQQFQFWNLVLSVEPTILLLIERLEKPTSVCTASLSLNWYHTMFNYVLSL